jgi:hypothetical protein
MQPPGREAMRLSLTLLTTLLLTGCINESASYYVAGNTHAISVRGHQEYFWDEQLTLTVVASRLPECQRQIPLAQVAKSDFNVELFETGNDGFVLRQGKQVWGVETTNCKELADAGKLPLGARVGAFKLEDDKFVFEAAPKAPAPAAPAAEAGTPAEAPAPEAPAAAPAGETPKP